MKIKSIDHIVLTVKNIEKTCRFYEDVLGMEKRIFGENRVALHFGQQKINLHQMDSPIDSHVRHATCGSADLCFVSDLNINEILDHLKNKNIDIIEGPAQRTGARGPIESIYLYDPDENLIEISNYL